MITEGPMIADEMLDYLRAYAALCMAERGVGVARDAALAAGATEDDLQRARSVIDTAANR